MRCEFHLVLFILLFKNWKVIFSFRNSKIFNSSAVKCSPFSDITSYYLPGDANKCTAGIPGRYPSLYVGSTSVVYESYFPNCSGDGLMYYYTDTACTQANLITAVVQGCNVGNSLDYCSTPAPTSSPTTRTPTGSPVITSNPTNSPTQSPTKFPTTLK